MTALAAAHGPSAYWYATRGAGATALALLTAALVLGIVETGGWQPLRAARFTVAAVHRSVSLLALAVLAVHIVTTLLDPFPRIGLASAVIPFAGRYRPLWVGLGAVAFDLLVAVAVTSLVRRRLGYRAWRAVHWAAYAVWPVALLHGLGAGSDPRQRWLQALTAVCVAAVLAAVGARLTLRGTPGEARRWVPAGLALALVALIAWAQQGPFAAGWARRAGTPPSVLAAFAPPARAAAVAGTSRTAAPLDRLAAGFRAALHGPIDQGQAADGEAVVDLRLALAGAAHGRLRIRIGGVPGTGGGVELQRSAVTLGPRSDPARYSGRIDALDGNQLRALVGSADGHALRLDVGLALGADHATGRVVATPIRGGGDG